MGLMEAVGPGPVAIDTAPFIYYMEGNPRYAPALQELFTAIADGRLQAYTSAVTLLEVLVVPYRAGNEALAARYEALLRHSRNLTLVPLSTDVLREGARLRAELGLKTPDALQLAAALAGGCRTLLTADRDFARVQRPAVVNLLEMV